MRPERLQRLRHAAALELEWRDRIERLDFPRTAEGSFDVPPSAASAHLLPFILRTKPDYLPGWFHRELCGALEWFSREVAAGRSPRLMVEAPPRHGKSEIVSRQWPVWHLGHHPSHQVVVASYGQDLANDMSRDARVVRDASLEMFPALAPGAKDGVEQWQIQGGGYYKAVGAGGPLTGKGAHCLVIDDPFKNADEADSERIRDSRWSWYRTTAYTRLAPGGGVLVMNTRWHHDDLSGRLLREAERGGDQWRRITFPAIAEQDEAFRQVGEALHPERYPLEALKRTKVAIGSRAWAAMYQQRPSPAAGGTFQRSWLQHYQEDPQRLASSMDEIIVVVDATFKKSKTSDFVVIQAWGRRAAEIFLLDQVRDRMSYTESRNALQRFAAKWRTASKVLVEDKANGEALLDDLRAVVPNLLPFSPGSNSKVARAELAAVAFEARQVWLPEPRWASWVGDYAEELAAFPTGAHDDQVDGTSMAVITLRGRRGGGLKARTAALRAVTR